MNMDQFMTQFRTPWMFRNSGMAAQARLIYDAANARLAGELDRKREGGGRGSLDRARAIVHRAACPGSVAEARARLALRR